MRRTVKMMLLAAVAAAAAPWASTAAMAGEALLGGPPQGVYRAGGANRGADGCPGQGWGAEYVPGVDAAGRPVAPADLDTRTETGPVISFDLPVNRRAGPRRRRDAIVGTVEVDTGSGEVAIDGVPLSGTRRAGAGRDCAGR